MIHPTLITDEIALDILNAIGYDKLPEEDLNIAGVSQTKLGPAFASSLKQFLNAANKYVITKGRATSRSHKVQAVFNGIHFGGGQQYNYLVAIQIGNAISYRNAEGIRIAADQFLKKFTSHAVEHALLADHAIVFAVAKPKLKDNNFITLNDFVLDHLNKTLKI